MVEEIGKIMFQKVTQPVTAEKTILVLPEKTKTANQEESHNCNMACKNKEARSTRRRSNNQKIQSVK